MHVANTSVDGATSGTAMQGEHFILSHTETWASFALDVMQIGRKNVDVAEGNTCIFDLLNAVL